VLFSHSFLLSLAPQVYLLYHIERQVDPVYKKTPFETRPFGAAMTVEDMIAAQTRIERQVGSATPLKPLF
jgi:hypothetical protein